MDYSSILLVLKLIKEGVGVAKEISELANRLLSGEQITIEEIETARLAVKNAAQKWNEEIKANQ